jgi:hypothetical protein
MVGASDHGEIMERPLLCPCLKHVSGRGNL